MVYVIIAIVLLVGGYFMFGKKEKCEVVTGEMIAIGSNEARFHLPFAPEDISVAFIDSEPPQSGCNPSPGDVVEIQKHKHHHIVVKWSVGEPRKIRWTAGN